MLKTQMDNSNLITLDISKIKDKRLKHFLKKNRIKSPNVKLSPMKPVNRLVLFKILENIFKGWI